jgi:organic radical activating enzyme
MDIQYLPNTNCNFRCDYCSNQDTYDFTYTENRKTITNIFKLLKKKNHSSNVFIIIGGEPSLSRDILKTVRYMDELRKLFNVNLRIDFQTNLSLKPQLYKEISKYVDFFHVAYHYKELKKHKRMKAFLGNLDFVAKANKLANLDIMLEEADDEFYEFTKEYIFPYVEYCKNSEMIYSYYGYDSTKTQRHKEFYEKYSKTKNIYHNLGLEYSTNDFFNRYVDKNPFKHKYCEAGLNSLVIFGDGKVFRCCGEMYAFFNKGGKEVCNINDDFTKADLPCTYCELDNCTGDLDTIKSDTPFTKEYDTGYREGEIF